MTDGVTVKLQVKKENVYDADEQESTISTCNLDIISFYKIFHMQLTVGLPCILRH